MKNLKSLFTVSMLLIFSLGLSAQYAVVMAAAPSADKIFTESAAEELVMNKKAVSEISEFIADEVPFPFEELSYLNEISVVLQVSVNTDGEIIDSRLVSTSDNRVGENILKAMKKKTTVTPITVNGVRTSQTFQIPVIFR